MQQPHTEQFIQERTYFKNVTPKTVEWYRSSFHAFDGAMDSRANIGERIGKLRNAGVSATSVNTYLRAVNAFLRWSHTEGHAAELIRIPKLKEDDKILATLSPEQVQRLIGFRPRGKVSAANPHSRVPASGHRTSHRRSPVAASGRRRLRQPASACRGQGPKGTGCADVG